MTAERARRYRVVCCVCGEPFQALTRRHSTCSAPCQRERYLRYQRGWYRAHRAEHIATVVAARKRRA